MKRTIGVAILFVAGLWPGLVRYQDGVSQPEPVLGWAQKLKLRS